MHIKRFLLLLLLSSAFSTATYAEVRKQKELNFTVDGESLKENVHYSFGHGDAKSLRKNFPEIARLDSQGILKKDSLLIVSKVAFIVEKAIGFFDHENLVKEDFVEAFLGDQEVKKVGPHTFSVQVPGKDRLNYTLRIFSDSDDVSTLPHWRVTESVTAFKKLDVISKSAPTISFQEMTEFSSLLWGGVKVSSYIPLKENKTLVITYHLASYREKQKPSELEKNLISEFLHQQKTLSDYGK